jgi:hypothetical protein
VLRPGFGPGSTAREAVILDRTILPELWLNVAYRKKLWFNKNSDFEKRIRLNLRKINYPLTHLQTQQPKVQKITNKNKK